MPRDKQSERMGFAWEPDELGDMSYEEAVAIVKDHDQRAKKGQISNEDPRTIDYARRRISRE